MEYQMKDLVIQCKNGDPQAQEELLLRLKPLIIASINRFYFGDEDMEDLLQDGYEKILIDLDRFDTQREVPFLGYLKLQLKYFYMEKGKRDKNRASQIIASQGEMPLIELIPSQEITEVKILKNEDLSFINHALRYLTKRQREIVFLYFIKGLKMSSISKILKVNYYTIVKTKDRALKNLRKNYTKLL